MQVKITEGTSGVTRLAYMDGNHHIGSARLLTETIGDITVNKPYQRKGYGSKILQDLRERGGKVAFAGSVAGARLLEKNGALAIGGGRYEFI